jgi:hypothetical protein
VARGNAAVVGSVPTMQISDHLPWVPSLAGSVAAAFSAGWLAGLVVFVVVATLTFVISDIRRAGGVPAWVAELVPALDKLGRYKVRGRKRRGEGKEDKVRLKRRLAKLRQR